MSSIVKEGYSGREVADLAGITYRQLDYWARTDVIRPSLTDASGSGSRRRYSKEDLVLLCLIRQMLDQGINLEMVRGAISDIREDLASGSLTKDSLLVISKDHGQYVANNSADLLDVVRRGSPCSIFPIDLDVPDPRPSVCPSCGIADPIDGWCEDKWHNGPRYG